MIALVLAACAAPGGGEATVSEAPSTAAGSQDMAPSGAPSGGDASASPAASDDAEASDASDRVAIDDVLTDPAALEGQPITLSENVEEVFVEDLAFLFSGTEVEGQVLVVVTPDATIGKEIQADRVVTVTGTLVPFTAEDLEGAGAGVGFDDEGLAAFEGDVVLVATEVADPLGG